MEKRIKVSKCIECRKKLGKGQKYHCERCFKIALREKLENES
jgi:hypothetical protein